MEERYTVGVVCIRGIGPERGGRMLNEDNYLVCHAGRARYRGTDGEADRPTEGAGLLAAVADGMGGHDHGDIASGAAVQSMLRLYARGRPSHPEEALHAFVLKAHRRLRDRARDRGAANMGTTLTAAWVLDGTLHWVHVGDSRLYLLRDGELQQVTRDHTRGEFAGRDGLGVPMGAHALTQNFIFGSRGLGDDDGIRVDMGVDTGAVRLRAGDRLLLTSDGVHGFLAQPRIQAGLSTDHARNAARWLVEEAMAGGSDDNVTAVVITVDAVPGEDADRDYSLWTTAVTDGYDKGG